ncbi:MAG: hypothetical protein Q9166_004106 [cf. Caloplaca sp. 2 TL-2023]
MERRRILVLLILFASPHTQTPSPSQRSEINHQVAQEHHALRLLNTSSYGDFNAGEDRWINVTGLRKGDGYAWDLLPKVQERAREQASTLIEAWQRVLGVEVPLVTSDKPKTTNATLTEASPDLEVPFYQNVTGIIHGHWVRSKVGNGFKPPTLNLTALAPRLVYTTDRYTRNVTGTGGELLVQIDEKRSESLQLNDICIREITAKLTLEDKQSGGVSWEMTLHGVHYPQDGSIVLTTTGSRFAGIFALPHFALSPTSFNLSRRLLNRTLSAAIKMQGSASETNALSPWSSSPQSSSDFLVPTPYCEYLVYLQQHPVEVGSLKVKSMESELRYPTGRLDITSPPVQMSALIFSPDCGFVLESKGPPDFASQDEPHLQGPKIESYLSSCRRAILALAVLICAEILLFLRQIREASTPSTKSRISYCTIGMLSMGDGLVAFLLLVISLTLDAASLPSIATAYLTFFCVNFLGIRFLIDIRTAQGPERDERRRQQERQHAAINAGQASLVPARTAIIATAGADSLPLPVTASRAASSTAFPVQGSQNLAAASHSPGLPATTQPAAAITQVDTAQREGSGFHARFVFILLVLLFLTLYSTTWPSVLRTLYIRALSMIYLSFWTPQIYRNITRNCRKALQWRFVAGQSILRVLPFAYFYLYQGNVLFIGFNSNWIIALSGWLWFQLCILVSQELFGPRFLLPQACSRWIPVAYDYHPILRDEDEESGASMPIGLTQASTPSTDISTATSSGGEGSGSKKEDDQKGKKSFDCAICMQGLEVPVVPRDAQVGGMSNGTAGLGVGIKDMVFGRRAYMITPCRHIFHISQMLLFHIHIILLLVTNIDSLVLNHTNAFPPTEPRLSDRLPNPYHVPHSPILLDFFNHATGPILPRSEIFSLLDKARQDILARLSSHGDMEIPSGTHQVKSDRHVFVYESKSYTRLMRYSEVLAVIRGFGAKERADECKYRLATVLYSASGGRPVGTGDAAILQSTPL